MDKCPRMILANNFVVRRKDNMIYLCRWAANVFTNHIAAFFVKCHVYQKGVKLQ